MSASAKIYMRSEELEERREWLTKSYEDDIAYIRKDLYDKLKEKYDALKSYTEHPWDCQMGS